MRGSEATAAATARRTVAAPAWRRATLRDGWCISQLLTGICTFLDVTVIDIKQLWAMQRQQQPGET